MKVAVCLPPGPSHRKNERCVRDLATSTRWPQIELESELASVHIARAILAERALESGADVTLWIDRDVTFDVQACETICVEALERNAIVGCLYLGKSFGEKPQASFLESGDVRCYVGGSLIEVEGIGLGLCAVPTSILHKIGGELPLLDTGIGMCRPYFTTDVRGSQFTTSDYALTERAKAAGFKIFADTRHRVGHLGYHEFFLEDGRRLERYESVDLKVTK